MIKDIKQDVFKENDITSKTTNGDWKPVIFDGNSERLTVPNGTIGQRWEQGKAWNLKLEDEQGQPINPLLSFAELDHEHVDIQFPYFDNNGNGIFERTIPVKRLLWKMVKKIYYYSV